MLPTIAFILDDRLSREKGQTVLRLVNQIRKFASIETIQSDITEEAMFKKLEQTPYALVLAPWYRYLAWSKIEAFYGLSRTSGPTFAGYFADQVLAYELGEQADHLRAILLDFHRLEAHEATHLIHTMITDKDRSGLRPLLDPKTPIYWENWSSEQGHGFRMDTVLNLRPIQEFGWGTRASAIRICLIALWSLVYEEGPGKGDMARALGTKAPRAFFQLAVEEKYLFFRVCCPMSGWGPKKTLENFWPDEKKPSAATQLLLRHADFVRVHTIGDSPEVLEITVGLLLSSPAEKSSSDFRTFWVEPLSPQIVSEPLASSDQKKMAAMAPDQLVPLPATPHSEELQNKEKLLQEIIAKLNQLKKMLFEREETIRELRSGGVGTAHVLPPPDPESLLEAFEERYQSAMSEIKRLSAKVKKIEKSGKSGAEVQNLKAKLTQMEKRESNWIKKILSILETYRNAKKQNRKAA